MSLWSRTLSPPSPLPTQSWEGDRKGAGLGRGGEGLDAFVCHGGGRRKGRGEPGSARERARCERGGRAGGGSSYLGRARLLAARLPGPRVTWGGGQVRTHWPPRRTARRARPQAAKPSGGSARPLLLAPACARRVPRSLRWAPRSRFPARVTPPGARGGCDALGSPWWQRVPGAHASPASRAEAPAERGPTAAPWLLPGPCPPARPLRPQLSMAQPPSLDHAQKLSKVDLLRVSLLWRPLREARVSISLGGGLQTGSRQPPEPPPADLGIGVGGGGRFLKWPGWLVSPALNPASLRLNRAPPEPEILRRGAEPIRSRDSAVRGRPQRGSRVAASVPGAYFHLFGLQAPGVGRAFPPPGCAGRRARAER